MILSIRLAPATAPWATLAEEIVVPNVGKIHRFVSHCRDIYQSKLDIELEYFLKDSDDDDNPEHFDDHQDDDDMNMLQFSSHAVLLLGAGRDLVSVKCKPHVSNAAAA